MIPSQKISIATQQIPSRFVWKSFCALFMLFCFTAINSTAVLADEDAKPSRKNATPAITDLQVGFENTWKLGFWIPCSVEVSAGEEAISGSVEVDAPDSDGVVATYFAKEEKFSLKANEKKRISFLIRVGQGDANITARFVLENGQTITKTMQSSISARPGIGRSLPGSSRLMLVLGPRVGLRNAFAGGDEQRITRTYVVGSDAIATLPESAVGYNGLNAVVLSAGIASSPVAKMSLKQRDALLHWVELGGRVIVVTSPKAEPLLAADGLLRPFLPGEYKTGINLRRVRNIEAFCGIEHPIKVRGGVVNLSVVQLKNISGRVLIQEGAKGKDVSLLIRKLVGFGEITFISFDLASVPLKDWSGRGELFRKLFEQLTSDEISVIEKSSSGLTSLGYDDLSGQLRFALDEFDSVRPVPFALVSALAILFIIFIGPIDYFLLKKWGRPGWTWLTLPILILLFSGFAWWLTNQFKGHEFHANQIELVDIDIPTGTIRGQLWSNVFSPELTAIDLTAEVQPLDGKIPNVLEVQASWQGLPGDALGGMRSLGEAPFSSRYSVLPGGKTLSNIPFAAWSSKSFSVTWNGKTDALLKGNLIAESDEMLSGFIENKTGVDLENVLLFHGRWAWTIGDFKAGQKLELSELDVPLTAKTVLTKRWRDPLNPEGPADYDQGSSDLDAILSMMMWYEHVGGPNYVRLIHRYQSGCDLSQHLVAGRAALVATVKNPGSRLFSKDQKITQEKDIRKVVYRFLFDVQPKNKN